MSGSLLSGCSGVLTIKQYRLEGLESVEAIDREIVDNIKSFRQILGIESAQILVIIAELR